MSKAQKNTQPNEADNGSDLNIPLTDAGSDPDASGAENPDSNSFPVVPGAELSEVEGIAVVVLKGNTLYHDGEKYPASSQLTLTARDAAPLLKRGVVMTHIELLKKAASNAG